MQAIEALRAARAIAFVKRNCPVTGSKVLVAVRVQLAIGKAALVEVRTQ